MRFIVPRVLVAGAVLFAHGTCVSLAHQEKEKKEAIVGNDICLEYATNEAKADAKYQDKIVRLTPGTHLARLIVTKVAKSGNDYVLIIQGYGGNERKRCFVLCHGISKEALQNAPLGKIVGVNVEQPSCVIEGEFLRYRTQGATNIVELKNCTLK